jgi:hypothetical protein
MVVYIETRICKNNSRFTNCISSSVPKGQWVEEQQNMVKLGMFGVGTGMPTVSKREVKFSAYKTFI